MDSSYIGSCGGPPVTAHSRMLAQAFGFGKRAYAWAGGRWTRQGWGKCVGPGPAEPYLPDQGREESRARVAILGCRRGKTCPTGTEIAVAPWACFAPHRDANPRIPRVWRHPESAGAGSKSPHNNPAAGWSSWVVVGAKHASPVPATPTPQSTLTALYWNP